MDIQELLKKPFADVKKLVIGSLIGLVPVLDFVLLGYGFDNYREPKKLPEFRLGDQFILGLKFVLVALIYLIPAMVLMAAGFMMALIPFVGMLGMLLVLAVVLPLIRALVEVGNTGSIGAAFSGKVFSEAFTQKFAFAAIGAILLSFAVSFVLNLIPVLGTVIATYASTVVFWTYLGSQAA